MNEIRAAAEELTQASHKLAEVMYQNAGAGAQQQQQQQQQQPKPESKDDVIEAEVVDENK